MHSGPLKPNKMWSKIRKILLEAAVFPVRIYQWIISPIIPASCRHTPTCSQYTIEAIKKHGIFIGTYLSVHRIIRCNPWGTHGYDPVPDKPYRVFKFKKLKMKK